MATLKNKVVLVTGASAGIGLEIAKESINQGAKVILHCSPNSIEKTKKQVDELGDQSSYFVLDLAEIANLNSMVNHCVEVFGRIDGLVNNAAIFPRNDIESMTTEDFDSIFNINVKAALFLTKAVVQYFKANNIKGSIVNIGSINAYCGQSDLLIYSMSKGALMTMTRNLSDSLAPSGIRVNQLNVGWTLTEKEKTIQLKTTNNPNWHQQINANFAPRGKILEPIEIAKHAAFWLSDDSSPVSGAIYEVEQYPVIGRNKINVSN